MTEEQGNDMLFYLQEISSKLTTIADRLEAIETGIDRVDSNTGGAYGLDDVCSRLDEVVAALENK